MQIFILDYNIQKNVEYYVDKHICKIQTEIAQILSTCIRRRCKLDKYYNNLFYKKTHEKHPWVIWAEFAPCNFEYARQLGIALHKEYNYRYPINKKYKKEKQIFEHAVGFIPEFPKKIFVGLTSFPRAIQKEKHPDLLDMQLFPDTVSCYREYYNREKNHLFKWTKREKPKWIKKDVIKNVENRS